MQFIQMIVGIVVARIAGPTVIGTVAFGLSYVSMFLFITDMGTPTAHIKLINDGEDEGNCIATFTVIKLFLIGCFVVVVLAVFASQKYFFQQSFESKAHEIVIFITLSAILISELYKIPNSTFVAHVEQAKQDIPQIITSLLFQVFRLTVVLLGYKAIAIASSKFIAALCIAPLYYFLFKNYPKGKFSRQLAKKYLAISLPVIIVVFSQTIIYWSDRVILQFLTNSAEVGFYSVSFGFCNFVRLIQTSAGTIFFPTFVKNLNENDFHSINKRLIKYERFNFIYVLPLILFAAIFSEIIVKFILGNQYLPTIPIFSIVIFAVFVPVLNLPYGNILFGKGLFKLSAVLFFTAMLFFVVVIFLLVHPLIFNVKGIGAAVALLSTNLLLGILFIVFVKKYAPQVKVFQDGKIGVIGMFYAVIFYFFFKFLDVGYLLQLGMIFIFFIGYWGMFLLLGMMTREDLSFVKEILNLNKMKNYIKDEIKKNKEKNENH